MTDAQVADADLRSPAIATAFISYARADTEVALRVVRALEAGGVGCAIDTRDLPYGERWQQELANLIRGADVVIFLVSPRSVASRWCKWELAQVSREAKRLVPAVVEPTAAGDLPPEIAEIQLLDLSDPATFDAQLARLAQIATTDLAWLKEHTRLADRAARWRARGDLADHLLRGRALRDAIEWRERRPATAPELSQEQLAYLLASQAGARRRQTLTIGGALFTAAAAVALALWAQGNASEARRQNDAALRHQSLFLADAARQLRERNPVSTPAALLALEALPDRHDGRMRPYVPEAERQLQTSLQTLLGQRHLMEHQAMVNHVAQSHDGRWMATSAQDRRVCLWADGKGPVARCLPHDAVVTAAWFLGETARVLSIDASGTLRHWDARTGQLLRHHAAAVRAAQVASMSPTGQRLAVADGQGTITLLDAEGATLGRIVLAPEPVRSLSFSRDGRWLVGSVGRRALVWAVGDGALKVALEGHTNDVNDASFSPDGQRIATGSSDGSLRLWDTGTGRQIGAVAGGESIWSVQYSPDGRRLLRATTQTVSVLDAESLQESFRQTPGAGGMVELGRAQWSPDGAWVLASDRTGSLLMWRLLADIQALVDHAKATVPSCLDAADRARYFLDPRPPLWCIEMQKDNYRGAAWNEWLNQVRQGADPPLPRPPS